MTIGHERRQEIEECAGAGDAAAMVGMALERAIKDGAGTLAEAIREAADG